MSAGARRSLHPSFWPALAALAAALALFEFTALDLAVQDRLFDFGRGGWVVDGAAAGPRLLFYTGPKAALILFGGSALLVTLAPRRWRERLGIDTYRRRGCVVLFLTLALVPSLVGWLKSATNVFCPAETRRYGGDVPYVRVLERFPENDRPARVGRCFPAGHASGGFALVGLVALARTRRAQLLGLGIAAAAGVWMGAYQMAKGAHYLSHTVVTALLAWLVFLLIERWTPGRRV